MKYILIILTLPGSLVVSAQKYKSSTSHIRFYSKAPMEDIEATTEEATSIIDTEKLNLVILVPIKTFSFKKKLMQEHFNENYMESEKFPRAVFKGKLEDWNGEEGSFKSKAVGTLEVHGVTQNVTIEGDLEFDGKTIKVSTVFPIKLKDHSIKIPKVLFYNIAEEVEVTANFEYLPYEKN